MSGKRVTMRRHDVTPECKDKIHHRTCNYYVESKIQVKNILKLTLYLVFSTLIFLRSRAMLTSSIHTYHCVAVVARIEIDATQQHPQHWHEFQIVGIALRNA